MNLGFHLICSRSLLVFDRNKSRFEHYDSMKNYHDEVAHNVFMKFSKHVVRKNSGAYETVILIW